MDCSLSGPIYSNDWTQASAFRLGPAEQVRRGVCIGAPTQRSALSVVFPCSVANEERLDVTRSHRDHRRGFLAERRVSPRGAATDAAILPSRITVVPVDVRVLDADGKPITNLKQEDFTITENGVPQSIRYFSTHSLTEDAAANGPLELRRAAAPDNLAPQNRRVFLILLGRGHMTGPSKELPALEAFLKTRLLSQDRVAVLAFNRATDLTTDHEAVRGVVERYRERHEQIETKLVEYFNGLRAVDGPKQIPQFLQADIDGIFGGSALRPRVDSRLGR